MSSSVQYCSIAIHLIKIQRYLLPCVSLEDQLRILFLYFLAHATWTDTLGNREEALRKRHMKTCERLSEHTKPLNPLVVGDNVRIQNQVGHNPKKWDKTGSVVEVRQFDQYVIRMDGSGRVTLRNRKFLRKYVPVYPQKPSTTINQGIILPSPDHIPIIPARNLTTEPLFLIPDISNPNEQLLVPADSDRSILPLPDMNEKTTSLQPADTQVTASPPIVDPSPQENTTLVRTSTRIKKQPAKFND